MEILDKDGNKLPKNTLNITRDIKPTIKQGDRYVSGGVNIGSSVQNLATVDVPKITEDKANGWAKWGQRNNFPQTLIDALNSSPTHNSIILTKKNMVGGKQVLIEPSGKGLLGRFKNIGKHKRTQDFIDQCNDKGESLQDVINKLAYDYLVFSQCYFQPIFNRSGGLQIEHIPTPNVRSALVDTKNEVNHFWVSKDWEYYLREGNKPVSVKKFDYKSKTGMSVVPIKPYRPASGLDTYYPLPEYYAAINYIELDGKISRFHLSNIDNGLVPSMLIQLNQGLPTEEQREELHKKITDTLTGSYNTGKFLLLFNDSKENEASIDTFENNNIDKQYILLNEMVLQNILTASRVSSPLLLGIKTPGQLGIIDELKSSYQIFYKSVIMPIQNAIMKEINKVGDMAGLKSMFIESPAPLEFMFTESILGKIMMINELRMEIGLDPVEGGDILIEYNKMTNNQEPVKENENTSEDDKNEDTTDE